MPTDLQKTLPAPVGGLNLRDPIYALPQEDARGLLNIFPDTSDVKVRGGSVKRRPLTVTVRPDEAPGLLIDPQFVGTLIPYYGKLYTFLSMGDPATTKFYEIDPNDNFSMVDRTGSLTLNLGFLSGTQFTIFNGALIMVADDSIMLDFLGTTLTQGGVGSAWSGISLTSVINVSSYRQRVYFVTKTGGLWYGNTGARGGALTEYDIKQVWTDPVPADGISQELAFCSTTNGGLGFRNQELFVAVGHSGEVLAFEGSSPSSETWNLVGRFRIPPLHRHGFKSGFFIGNDLHIITTAGIVPMSGLLGSISDGGEARTTTEKVSQYFITAGNALGYYLFPVSDLPVASAVWNPRKKMVIVNLGYSEGV